MNEMRAYRRAYICPRQRLDVFMENVNFSMHFHSWKSGLKTGMYYLHTKAATDAIKFTMHKSKLNEVKSSEAGVRWIEYSPNTLANERTV